MQLNHDYVYKNNKRLFTRKKEINLTNELDKLDYAHKFYKATSGKIMYKKGSIYHVISFPKPFDKFSNSYYWMSFFSSRKTLINDGVVFWKESKEKGVVELLYTITKEGSSPTVMMVLQNQLEAIASIKEMSLLTKIVNDKITPEIMKYNNWNLIGINTYQKN